MERRTISLSLSLSRLVVESSPRRRVVALSRVTSTTPSHPAPMASRAVGRSVGRAGRGVSLELRLVDRTIERWENRTIGALRARGTRTKGGAGVAVGRTNVRTSVVRTFERMKMKIERSSDRRGWGGGDAEPYVERVCRVHVLPSHGEWCGVCMGMDIVQGRCGGVFVIDESGPVVMEAGQGATTRGGTVGGDERRREARRGARRLFSTVGDLTMVRGRRWDDGTMRWDGDVGVRALERSRWTRGDGERPFARASGCVVRASRGSIDRPRGVDVARCGA